MAALLWPWIEQGVFFWASVLIIHSLVDMLLLRHDNVWCDPPGAVHTQHDGDGDAQRSVRVPRGKPHRAAGGAPPSSREADQPGHQVRKRKHETCTRTHTHPEVLARTDSSPPPFFFPMCARLSACDIPVCGLTNVINQLTGLHSSGHLTQWSVFLLQCGGGKVCGWWGGGDVLCTMKSVVG